jgi:hypothetical protein
MTGYLFEYSSAAKNPARVSRLPLHLLVRFSVSKQLFAPRKTMADSPTDIDVVFAFKRAAEPTITLTKSRRRIAFLKAWDHANPSMITAGICDRRNGVSGQVAQQQS